MNKIISVIVPTYNERENIIPLVEQIHHALSNHEYRILFVDDDSRDGTAELAQSLSPKYPVSVIVRQDQKGLASAVVDGLKHTNGETIVVMDADLQHPPEVLPDLLETINNGADIAVASRYVPGGGCHGWGLIRRIISRVAIFLSHLFLPSTRHVKDPMSGFFMFSRQVVANAELKPAGYKILLEILVLGDFHHAVEVPYTFRIRSRGESKLSGRQQIAYLRHIYSLMRRTGEIWRILKFCLVGISGIFVNEGLLWILAQLAGFPLVMASPISIECSIISNFTLNNFFTFHDRRSLALKSTLYRLLKFNLVSLGGLGINLGVLLFFTDVVGVYYLVANLFGIVVAFMWNYILSTWWTWK
jgi:dolichol-phosphate mannosyltransferase